MTYGERLQQAIKETKSSRGKVAAAVGITVQAVGQVINGHTGAFTAANNAGVAKALGVSSHWLATGQGDMFESGSHVGGEASPTHSNAVAGTSLAPPLVAQELMKALTALTSAVDKADKLTIAQVTPLFSMLIEAAARKSGEAGTIAQRLAELLATPIPQAEGPQESGPAAPTGLDVRINQNEGKSDGKGGSASANERKAGRGRAL